MDLIIVGIDFSDSSINCLEHALSIARKAEADLLMVWVSIPSIAKKLLSEKDADINQVVEGKFADLVHKYQPTLPNNTISFTIRQGKVYKELAKISREKEADLILVGTHGTSGYDPFWIGSNANKLISIAHCPVITIRLGVDINRDLKKIILPLDDSRETRQKVAITTDIALYFGAEVHIVGIYTSSVDHYRNLIDSYCDQVVKHFVKFGVKFIVEKIEASNITKATIDYAMKVDANLITIMTEQTTSAMNLWLGPFAQQMVNQSPIPVLSVHPKEHLRLAPGL
ncbi:MAG TPA: universal stress protein [Bacteroidales bacterium]|nr:universal stress protein [Bacteroidales bacterium]HRZ49800.1 universal stress protein [Bacteroidales bacterium]